MENPLRAPVEVILDAVVFLVTIFILLVWLIVLSPLYLWRQVVKLLAKCFKHKVLGEMLPPLETFFYGVIETNYDNEPEAVPCLMLSLEGHMDFQLLQFSVLKYFVSIEGNVRLRQYITEWLGFPFFQWEEKFDILDHVSLVTDQHITESTKCSQVMNLARKKFKNQRSPWEIVEFPYTENDKPKTMLILRAHHIVGDGRSFFKILIKMNGQEENRVFSNVNSIQKAEASWTEKIKRAYQFNVALPRLFFSELPKLTKPPSGILQKSPTEDRGQVLMSETVKFPLELFKALKRDLGAPFTVIITTALCKSLFYLNNRNQRGQPKINLNVVQEFHGTMPLPLPKHPDHKLVNHFLLTKLSMISGNETSAAERLQLNKKHLEDAGRVMLQFAVAQTVFINIISSLPVFVSRMFSSETRRAFLMSNMPGPTETLHAGPHLMSDFMFFVPDVMNFGATFSVVSYNGFVKIGVCVDSAVAGGSETLNRMIQIIQDELNDLFSLVKV